MSGFVYYLPRDAKNVTLAEARRAGLEYAFPASCGPFTPRGVTAGPDGKPGVVFGDDNRVSPAQTKYVADKQTWRPVLGTDAWVGYWTDDPPGPDDLSRRNYAGEEDRLPGHAVRLWDGNQWLVPVAAEPVEQDGGVGWTAAVPQLAVRNADGKWVPGDVVAKYEALWALASAFADVWWRELTAADERESAPDEAVTVQFDYCDSIDGAIVALSYNYAIGPTEVEALGLLSGDVATDVLLAMIDWPTSVAAQKKSSPSAGDSPSAGGSPAVTPDTGPA